MDEIAIPTSNTLTFVGDGNEGDLEFVNRQLFPIDVWNQHDKGAEGVVRTTNSVEGWHRGLQAFFQCHRPTLWTFLMGIVAQDLSCVE